MRWRLGVEHTSGLLTRRSSDSLGITDTWALGLCYMFSNLGFRGLVLTVGTEQPDWGELKCLRVGNVRSSSYVCVRFFQQTCLLNAWCFTDSGESACNAGDASAIPASGRPPGGGHDNPLQYSCLENPMDRGAWRGTVHGVTKSQTNIHTYAHTYTRTHAHTHTCMLGTVLGGETRIKTWTRP